MPHPPFANWPLQWTNDAAGYLWVSERPAALVTQCSVERVTPEAVNWMHDVLDQLVANGFFRAHPELVAVHDWRIPTSFDALARATYQRRTRMRPQVHGGIIYVALSARSIVRMTIQAAALAMQLGTGRPPI